MEYKYVFIKSVETQQKIQDDYAIDDIIEPFIPFNDLLALFYTNSYHRRAITIKAQILSQIQESDLEKVLPENTSPRDFLYSFVLNLEIFGNGFIEQAGTPSSRALYILPTIEARVGKNFKIHQKLPNTDETNELEGYHLKYYSPSSRYYGEPDYMAVFQQVVLESKINQYNNAFFDNNAKPDLAIIFEGAEPSDEQLQAFRAFFETSYKGYLNAHKTLVISAPSGFGDQTPRIRIEKLSQIEDMSFKNLKEVNRDEIIAAHGVPPRLVGVVAPGHLGGGSELVSQLHAFNETVIKPKIQILEDFFKEIVKVNLKLKPLDITTFKDDADVIAQLVQLGIISVADAKEILGWNKKEVLEE